MHNTIVKIYNLKIKKEKKGINEHLKQTLKSFFENMLFNAKESFKDAVKISTKASITLSI